MDTEVLDIWLIIFSWGPRSLQWTIFYLISVNCDFQFLMTVELVPGWMAAPIQWKYRGFSQSHMKYQEIVYKMKMKWNWKWRLNVSWKWWLNVNCLQIIIYICIIYILQFLQIFTNSQAKMAHITSWWFWSRSLTLTLTWKIRLEMWLKGRGFVLLPNCSSIFCSTFKFSLYFFPRSTFFKSHVFVMLVSSVDFYLNW